MSAIVQCWLGGPHPPPPQSSWHFLPKTTEYSSHYKTRKSAHLLSFFPVILQKGTLKQKMLEKGIIFVNTFEKPWHVPFKPVFYLMEVLLGPFMLSRYLFYLCMCPFEKSFKQNAATYLVLKLLVLQSLLLHCHETDMCHNGLIQEWIYNDDVVTIHDPVFCQDNIQFQLPSPALPCLRISIMVDTL